MDKHTANIFIGFILIITIYGLQLKPSEPFSNYIPPPPRIKTMTEHTPTLKCNRSTNPTSNCYTLKPNYWKQYQSQFSPELNAIFHKPSIAIDGQCTGWKQFWKNNYSTMDPNLKMLFNEGNYNSQHNKLLFDGVHRV